MNTKERKPAPKALLFDVFGTVVDWRTSVPKYLADRCFETLNSPASSIGMHVRFACAAIDWESFTQEWRTSYYEFTSAQANRSDNDSTSLKTVDDHHYDSLRALLVQHGIDKLWREEEVFVISRVWHYLDGWPDSTSGLQKLQDQGFVVCTLSNGNPILLNDMAEFANLPWTRVLSAEKFGTYKPHPSVYVGACEELGFKAEECAMVAAHLGDLQAASKCGLQTIYVEREGEEAWPVEKVTEAKKEAWVDLWIGLDEKTAGGGILKIAKHFETERRQ